MSDVRRTLTWADLERETNQFGRGLEARGLVPGDHVAVVARNHVEFLVAIFGSQRAGMVTTPVKTGWTAAEIAYLLGDAESRAVVTDIPAGREAAAELGLVVVDFEDDHAAWLASQDDAPLPYDRCGWKMSYTSGTTGRPKGVRLETSGTTPFTDAFRARPPRSRRHCASHATAPTSWCHACSTARRSRSRSRRSRPARRCS